MQSTGGNWANKYISMSDIDIRKNNIKNRFPIMAEITIAIMMCRREIWFLSMLINEYNFYSIMAL
jgi:hypothetical protein